MSAKRAGNLRRDIRFVAGAKIASIGRDLTLELWMIAYGFQVTIYDARITSGRDRVRCLD